MIVSFVASLLLTAAPVPRQVVSLTESWESVPAYRDMEGAALQGFQLGSALGQPPKTQQGSSRRRTLTSPGERAALDAIGDFFTVVGAIAGVLFVTGIVVGLAITSGGGRYDLRAGTPPTSIALIRF